MSIKSKKTRKNQGIIQSGGNKGKLKKGYKYSGKKLKSGLPQILKVTKKKKKIQRAGGNAPIKSFMNSFNEEKYDEPLTWGTGSKDNPKYVMSTWDSTVDSTNRYKDNYGLYDVLKSNNGMKKLRDLFLIDNNDLYKKDSGNEDAINERNEIYVLLVGAIQASQFVIKKKGDNFFYPLSPNINKHYSGHNISSILINETGLIIEYAFNHNAEFTSTMEHAETRAIRRAMTNFYSYKHLQNKFITSSSILKDIETPIWWLDKQDENYKKTKMTNKLSTCSLYSSLESCAQCSGVMALARMDRVSYLIRDTGYFNIGNIIHNLLKDAALASPKPMFSFNYTYVTCVLALSFELTWLFMKKLSEILEKFYKSLPKEKSYLNAYKTLIRLRKDKQKFDEKELLKTWNRDILVNKNILFKIEKLILEFNTDIKNNSVNYLNKIYSEKYFKSNNNKLEIKFSLNRENLEVELQNDYVNSNNLKSELLNEDIKQILDGLEFKDGRGITLNPVYIDKKDAEFKFISSITDYLITNVCYQIYNTHRKILYQKLTKKNPQNNLFKLKYPEYKNLYTRTWTKKPIETDEKYVLTNNQVLLECIDFDRFVDLQGFRGTSTGNL